MVDTPNDQAPRQRKFSADLVIPIPEEWSPKQVKPRFSLKLIPVANQPKKPEVATREPSSKVSPSASQSILKIKNLLPPSRKQIESALMEISRSSTLLPVIKSKVQLRDISTSSNMHSDLHFSPKLSPIMPKSPSPTSSFIRARKSSEDFDLSHSQATSIASPPSEPASPTLGLIKRSEIMIEQLVSNDCLRINQYILERRIGKGTSWVAYSAQDTELGERRAVKVFDKKMLKHRFNGQRTALFALRNELEMISLLDHPNIIKTYEVIESNHKSNVFLVLELAANGSLSEVCPLSRFEAWNYFTQLVSVIDYLHNDAKIVHRDLKPQNLMLDSNYKLKLVDFGTAQKIASKEIFVNVSGSHAFMAPELILGAKFCDGKALDIWAAGITLYYFIEGCTPFTSRKTQMLYEEISTVSINYSSRIQGNLRDLLERMLEKDPAKRIKLNEIQEHPYVKQRPSKI
mmetsp:Transcript_1685/g.3608  ORF Transcript_1685/g.3608 Transcript_1685/m.3608 type:complete len:460 (+) Transcript_1685:383-1762(+)